MFIYIHTSLEELFDCCEVRTSLSSSEEECTFLPWFLEERSLKECSLEERSLKECEVRLSSSSELSILPFFMIGNDLNKEKKEKEEVGKNRKMKKINEKGK